MPANSRFNFRTPSKILKSPAGNNADRIGNAQVKATVEEVIADIRLRGDKAVVPITLVCLLKKTDSLERWAGGLVVAGGASNLIDRIQTGAVVDFLDLHWRGWHWPAFNLADSYIFCAIFVWVLLCNKTDLAQATPEKNKAQA